ncbi:hypothetical protein A163_21040 [Vibrio tasmaniensis 1F-267]|uniref:Uncharacterized protein n=2 Tax=Vibrionaceae TaxID=641 RepID=A0ABX3B6Q4_9VIBR|nr:hypothetical protein A163_21040 [Vibrio tasmaniensis 1F-267]
MVHVPYVGDLFNGEKLMFYIQLLNTRVGYCLADDVKVNGVLKNCLQCGDIEDKEHWVNKVHKVHGGAAIGFFKK